MKIESIEDIQRLIAHCDYNPFVVREWLKEHHDEYNVVCRHLNRMIIFSYDKQCDHTNRWNWFERNARGLIFDVTTAELVSRPFPKFFNWGQNGENTTTAPIKEVLCKEDGSLGILYINEYRELCVATRGSLDSEQARWATDFLRNNMSFLTIRDYIKRDNITVLVEIIYPENRIVVDYEGRKDLILLGCVDNETGETLPWEYSYKLGKYCDMSLCERYTNYHTVQELISRLDELSINEEGFVVIFEDGLKAKFKGAEYLAAHRLISHLTLKHVREAMLTGEFQNMLFTLPDEFIDEAEALANVIHARVVQSMDAFKKIEHLLEMNIDQKQFALTLIEYAPPNVVRAAMFSVKSGKMDKTDLYNYFLSKLEIRGDE